MNTIDRTYRVRGKQVHLQELADLVAVRSDQTDQKTMSNAALEGMTSKVVALPNLRAFEDAGWTFVPREETAEGTKVYLKSGGRVALGTNRLTVHVAGKHSEEEARNLLESQGVRVVDRLKFAPNLFVVAVPEGQDVIETAERLTVTGEFAFAEPELIEVISGR